LVVLKLWQARDTFDPERLMRKFEDGREFDWNDLEQLVRRTLAIDPVRITGDCTRGYRFLTDLTDDDGARANDQYQREHAVAERLQAAAI
jgi:hypothetical protein